jgi:cytochrome c biogenesis protein CcmG/thiol:disulfide interchange protein DsbE
MHRRRLWLLSALLACASSTAREAPRPADGQARSEKEVCEVRGRVLGHDGAPMHAAHYRLAIAPPAELIEGVVAADGAFAVETACTGIAKLEFTGTDHAAASTLVVLEDDVDLTVRLGTHPRPGPLADVHILYWTGDPEATEPELVPLEKQPDGTWRVKVKTDAKTVRYQVGGTAGPSLVVNGPTGDRYEPDGGGDYRSVLQVEGGAFEVVVDEAALPPAHLARTVAWGDPASPSSRLARAIEAGYRDTVALGEAINASAMTDPAATSRMVKEHDWSEARRVALAALADEQHAAVRHGIIGEYFSMGSHDAEHASASDRALAAELLGDMPATDPGWALFSDAMVTAVKLSPEPRHRERYAALLDDELPAALAADLLFADLLDARAHDDLDAARKLVARLQRSRFRETGLAEAAKQYDPDGPLGPGKVLPEFAVAALRGKKKGTVTQNDLRGKIYLIDLWATWCMPCVAEMGTLQAAFAKYGRRGSKATRPFGILSISLDDDPAAVEAFRKHVAMPWDHGHVAFDGASAMFGVSQIPFALLVDERGTILASGTALTGKRLEALLAQHLARR